MASTSPSHPVDHQFTYVSTILAKSHEVGDLDLDVSCLLSALVVGSVPERGRVRESRSCGRVR